MSATHPRLRRQTDWREEIKNNCLERLLRKETRTLIIMSMEPLIPLRTNFSELAKTNFQTRFFLFGKIKTLSNVYRLFLSRQEHQKLQLDIIPGRSETPHHGRGILSGDHRSLTSNEGADSLYNPTQTTPVSRWRPQTFCSLVVVQ